MVSVVVWAWSQETRGLHGADVHMASLAGLGSVSPWLQSGGPARSGGAVGDRGGGGGGQHYGAVPSLDPPGTS